MKTWFPIVVAAFVAQGCIAPNSFENDRAVYGPSANGAHRQILQANCYACHSPGDIPPDLTADDATLVQLGWLYAGNADGSPLIHKVQGTLGSIMPPPPYSPLTTSEIQTLKDWINAITP